MAPTKIYDSADPKLPKPPVIAEELEFEDAFMSEGSHDGAAEDDDDDDDDDVDYDGIDTDDEGAMVSHEDYEDCTEEVDPLDRTHGIGRHTSTKDDNTRVFRRLSRFSIFSRPSQDEQCDVEAHPCEIAGEKTGKRKCSAAGSSASEGTTTAVEASPDSEEFEQRPKTFSKSGLPDTAEEGGSLSSPRQKRRYSSVANAKTAQQRSRWEPGIDVTTTEVMIKSLGSAVTIVDYCAARYRVVYTEVHGENTPAAFRTRANQEFEEHLRSRPSWSKVRWINVTGMSWQAIEPIVNHFGLHRLAVEDMIDIPQRTKVDKYPNHTFCCFPLQKLVPFKPTTGAHARYSQLSKWLFGLGLLRSRGAAKQHGDTRLDRLSRGSADSERQGSRDFGAELEPAESLSSPVDRTATKNSRQVSFAGASRTSNRLSTASSLGYELRDRIAAGKMKTMYQWNNPTVSASRATFLESRKPLASKHRMVGVEQVSMFLTSQRTVITFFEQSGADVERPILARLSTESTLLRESSDPSILLQAIIDSCVELIHPIISAYRSKLDELELDAIVKPTMSHTRDLHAINAELTMIRNTVVPITSMINSLREHATSTVDRSNKGLGLLEEPGEDQEGGKLLTRKPQFQSVEPRMGQYPPDIVADVKPRRSAKPGTNDTAGRVSEFASVYLADVADHTMTYTQDFDVMRNNAKAMIDLIFNTISIQSSDAVKLLSLVTVIFLPLTFLTGYFGMNFTDFSSLQHGDGFYWGVAMPFSAIMTILLMYAWVRDSIRKMQQSLSKQRELHRRKKKKKALKERTRLRKSQLQSMRTRVNSAI